MIRRDQFTLLPISDNVISGSVGDLACYGTDYPVYDTESIMPISDNIVPADEVPLVDRSVPTDSLLPDLPIDTTPVTAASTYEALQLMSTIVQVQ